MRVAVRNIAWLLMSQMATWGMSIVMLIFAPRWLGDVDYGKIQFAVTFVGFFVLAAGLGTDTYIVKTVARDPGTVGRYVFNTLLMKACLASALAVVAFLLAVVLGYERQTLPIIAVSCGAMIVGTLGAAIVAGLQGLERMQGTAVWAAVAELLSTVIALVVVARHGSLVLFAAALSSGALITLVANGSQLWPEIRAGMQFDFALWKTIARGGLPFLMWNAVLLVYGTIDIPLLQSMAGSKTVGWYTIAYRWASLPAFFASVVVTALLPSLSARGAAMSSAFAQQANKALRLVFAAAAPIAVGIVLVADEVLTLLYHDSGFHHAVPVMQIIAVHLPLVSINMMLGTALIASDRQRPWILLACGTTVLNIVLNVVAIPWSVRHFQNGAIGAAIVTVSTEFLMTIGAVLLRPEGVLDATTARHMARLALSSLAMIPTVLLVRDAWLGYQILVGATTFGAVGLLTRAITIDELRSGVGQVVGAVRGRAATQPKS